MSETGRWILIQLMMVYVSSVGLVWMVDRGVEEVITFECVKVVGKDLRKLVEVMRRMIC
jgi:hypothetical protein